MTHDALVDELQARGFGQLTDARASVYINLAYHELQEMFSWPWREKSVTGVAPLTVTDLGLIELVSNETVDYPIQPADFRWLADQFGDLSTSGAPVYYYVALPSDVPVVATYPTNGDTIGVQYWQTYTDISGSTEPSFPARHHYVLVDMAAQRAYLDTDNVGAAQALQPLIDRQLMRMVNAFLGGMQAQAPVETQALFNSADS